MKKVSVVALSLFTIVVCAGASALIASQLRDPYPGTAGDVIRAEDIKGFSPQTIADTCHSIGRGAGAAQRLRMRNMSKSELRELLSHELDTQSPEMKILDRLLTAVYSVPIDSDPDWVAKTFETNCKEAALGKQNS